MCSLFYVKTRTHSIITFQITNAGFACICVYVNTLVSDKIYDSQSNPHYPYVNVATIRGDPLCYCGLLICDYNVVERRRKPDSMSLPKYYLNPFYCPRIISGHHLRSLSTRRFETSRGIQRSCLLLLLRVSVLLL